MYLAPELDAQPHCLRAQSFSARTLRLEANLPGRRLPTARP
jgi:hypothetical protein